MNVGLRYYALFVFFLAQIISSCAPLHQDSLSDSLQLDFSYDGEIDIGPEFEEIALTINLPPEYRMLFEANPSIRLMKKTDKKILFAHNINSNPQVFNLTTEYHHDMILNVHITYCSKIDENGLCVIKDLYYDLKFDPLKEFRRISVIAGFS